MIMFSVFAGQNESGKSSILKALYDFERGKFSSDSVPFSIDGQPTQTVSCTYKKDSRQDIFYKLFRCSKK